jgi:hypothetical protein
MGTIGSKERCLNVAYWTFHCDNKARRIRPSIGGPCSFSFLSAALIPPCDMLDRWFSLSIAMMKLGLESQQVILLRLVRLSAGGAVAHREASRMAAEKMIALASEALAMGLAISAGRSHPTALQSTVKSYRKRVAGNRRRLRRSRK